MSMKIQCNGGIVLGENELVIDPSNGKSKAGNVFITHAHSDHAQVKNREKNYFMSKETHSLIKTRNKVKGKIKEIRMGEKIKLNSSEIYLHPSGHILGSSQIRVEGDKTIVFTSDFRLQDSLLFEGAEILPSDILVIESTFGLPEYVFPEREKVYEEMSKWMKENLSKNRFLVLGGYSIGKAQELTRIVNEFTEEIPLVHEKIFNANKVYEENGVKLGKYIKLGQNLKESNVLIMPPHLMEESFLHYLSLSLGKSVAGGIATGWDFYKKGVRGFPLSDHADFNQLMRYVKESSPKQVFTNHGFAKEFAHSIKRKLGINARPLDGGSQRTLSEFD